ncbi:MAG: phosphoribosylanthranilate isomerase [Deltaproteobacteria bacterium]|nr:phosphoribosylanthranilate isomerase [Deltaproteobacteria bacterium]
MVKVKICGVTSVEDAVRCVAEGADAIGINFYKGSSRCCDKAIARTIVDAVAKDAVTVGVFVDAGYDEIYALRKAVGFSLVQLHGDEAPDLLARLLPHAFKALKVRGPTAVDESARYGGDCILLDAYVPGVPGGTGEIFDWAIARQIARTRRVVLAGGLTHRNVALAVARVAPSWVDVASGVEISPGRKNMDLVRAFIQAAKKAQGD